MNLIRTEKSVWGEDKWAESPAEDSVPQPEGERRFGWVASLV